MVEISQFEHFLLSFCLRIRLDVVIDEIEANPNETPEQYCERAQKKLGERTEFKSYNAGYRCRQEHTELVKKTMKERKQ